MQQSERLKFFKEFKEYKHRILVSTNLFGRGVDIERVNIVINYDMPQDSDEYLHRVGRAGRFGTKGLAITFVSTADEGETMKKLQERFKVKVNIYFYLFTSIYATDNYIGNTTSKFNRVVRLYVITKDKYCFNFNITIYLILLNFIV